MSPELRITVSGEEPARQAALSVLLAGLDVSSVSRPYPNRQDPGARVYVHARPRQQNTDQQQADEREAAR